MFLIFISGGPVSLNGMPVCLRGIVLFSENCILIQRVSRFCSIGGSIHDVFRLFRTAAEQVLRLKDPDPGEVLVLQFQLFYLGAEFLYFLFKAAVQPSHLIRDPGVFQKRAFRFGAFAE